MDNVECENTSKRNKNITQKRLNWISCKIKKLHKIDFKLMPKDTQKTFLGVIRRQDIIAIATFTLINGLKYEDIYALLNTLKSLNCNTFDAITGRKIARKINNISQIELKFREDLDLANLRNIMMELEGDEPLPLPDIPKYYAYNIKKKDMRYLTGEPYDMDNNKQKNEDYEVIVLPRSLIEEKPVHIKIIQRDIIKKNIYLSYDGQGRLAINII